MQIGIKVVIKGFVQGVGYRYFCYRKAMEYDLTGYVKNLFDGSVEVEAEGDEHLIKDFIKDLRVGPMSAKVNSVTVEEFTFENKYSKFKVY